jgi:hypothetical protein
MLPILYGNQIENLHLVLAIPQTKTMSDEYAAKQILGTGGRCTEEPSQSIFKTDQTV